jgi:hypothetical protein
MGLAQSAIPKRLETAPAVAHTPIDRLFIEQCSSATGQELRKWLSAHSSQINVNITCVDEHEYFMNHPRTVLHLLAYDGEPTAVEKVQLLVTEFGADVEHACAVKPILDEDDVHFDEDEGALTPLYVAVDRKHADMVRALVGLKANLNQKLDYSTASPLAFAVQRDDAEFAALLLACGSDPNVKDSCNYHTPLRNAVSVTISEMLLCAGADVNARTSMNWTNLNFTPVRGSYELAVFLVANGANPRARDSDMCKTPQYTTFLDDPVRLLYQQAEKYFKILQQRWAGEPLSRHLSVSETAEFTTLEHQLAGVRLTEDRKRSVLEGMYLLSERSVCVSKGWAPGARQTAIAADLCLQRTVLYDLRQIILSFLSKGPDEMFDIRRERAKASQFDYMYYDEALSDACTENNFEGGSVHEWENPTVEEATDQGLPDVISDESPLKKSRQA